MTDRHFADVGVTESIWITWSPPHRRTRELAKAFGMPLHEFYRREASFVRYVRAAARTTALLLRHRPRVVLVQVPSLVLALFALALSRPLRFRVVCDQHNDTVQPFAHRGRWYWWLCAFVIRRAALNIVTNEPLAAIVAANGGLAAVLPDKIPEIPEGPTRPLGAGAHVVFICSFAADEPYLEVIEAARFLRPDVTVHITGNPRNRRIPEFPPNVRATGYLPDDEYLSLLRSADVLVDLTLIPNCLVCGGYEAIALHKPLVTSATEVLRTHFGPAAVYCQPDRESIADAIRRALINDEALRRASAERDLVLRREWAVQKGRLMELLQHPSR